MNLLNPDNFEFSPSVFGTTYFCLVIRNWLRHAIAAITQTIFGNSGIYQKLPDGQSSLFR